ncbi:hypothetical protein CCACVL1_20864 [Corchorus capsularis]|uniref:Uncharacterized protein n=1 Tax=Corchorus capsularis TaxID=210143 RepID=A0A1R3H9G2_COCAP|nr:hypothetical protein CCACVL1_20864 [Corchorus capsularis]
MARFSPARNTISVAGPAKEMGLGPNMIKGQ